MYSIYDEGLGRLMSAGRNSPTKETAKEALCKRAIPGPPHRHRDPPARGQAWRCRDGA
jgi:hypothetical protein